MSVKYPLLIFQYCPYLLAGRVNNLRVLKTNPLQDVNELVTIEPHMNSMAVRVVEFSNGGYKIRKIFAKGNY